jgi:CRISPR-associated endonuclease/helicase Cas3
MGEATGALLWASLGHHGAPPTFEPTYSEASRVKALWRVRGPHDPLSALRTLTNTIRAAFPTAWQPGPALPGSAVFHHGFAGLVALADWIGSDTRYFPVGPRPADLIGTARERAREAISAFGINPSTARESMKHHLDFAGIFGWPPRPPQSAVGAGACLPVSILEAATGAGKTEAALWRFITLFSAGAVDSLYFALPTRVAATQIQARVLRAIKRVFPEGARPAVVLAIPGQQQADEVRPTALPDFAVLWPDSPDEVTERLRWAAETPRRFLAATIAIGTVDQVLMAALKVKHAHLRGTALLRSLLVVDEVHASDRYMTTLLREVLRRQATSGGHALLMSATLGAEARAALLEQAVPSIADAQSLPFPALSDCAGTHAIGDDSNDKRVAITLRGAMNAPAAVAAMALAAARNGAKVLVIRSTVSAAVATQAALEDIAGLDAPQLFHVLSADRRRVVTLHHGRFAATDRRRLDRQVEARLGQDAPAGGIIVVGTQTLEVSLDLDADILLTDLCPIDVLLQRIGRLHRHERQRPAGFETAQCIVLTPQERDLTPLLATRTLRAGAPGLGNVYPDLRVIEATWQLLERYSTLCLPKMNRLLVEGATHGDALRALGLDSDARWSAHGNEQIGRLAALGGAAKLNGLDWRIPYADSGFPAKADQERMRTRIGADSREIEFDPALKGPFGQLVSALVLPGHMLRGVPADAVPIAAAADDGFTFRIGGLLLDYGRLGCRLLV